MRFRLATAAAACALAFDADPTTFHTTLTLVKADAYMYDRQSYEPILGLQASDFRILDEINPAISPISRRFRTGRSALPAGRKRSVFEILPEIADAAAGADSLVNEQLSESGAVLDGLLLRGAISVPRVTHPGILDFARNSGGEVIAASANPRGTHA
jgi:hypothetical protein